jgi:exopolysaccharide/PEP-CTERM locus tyrosine autokinase
VGTGKSIVVDVEAMRGVGVLPPKSEERQLADQFRMIKRPLVEHAFQAGIDEAAEETSPRSVIITSALPGDGKTFTAVNLAFSLAREKDSTVVLVDADVAKRDVSRLFGLVDAPGLLDAITDPALAVESLICPSDFPGLSVLPAGHMSDSATELLASARMRELMASLTALNPHCLVVFDSPPILLTTEAPVLTSLFGQIVVVVKAGVTPQQAVLDALRYIDPGSNVSLVLNGAADMGAPGFRAGYGHGYGYHRPPLESENNDD